MYIDDEEALVQLTIRVLQKKGHVVEGFTDPRAALAAFRVDPVHIDLVVTDFNMPGMSGLDTARKLKEIRPEVPIVLATGCVTDDLIERSRGSGIQRVIHKANTVREFCESILLELGATSTKNEPFG
jgi:CheY-like chemotaxis protein